MKRLILITLLALIPLVGCQTDTVPPLLDVAYAARLSDEPVLVQVFSVSGKSDRAIKDAIVRAANIRQWEVTQLDDGSIQTKLRHRSSESTLWFTCENGQVEIHSLSYEIDKNTLVRKKRAEPAAWIRNLHKDILVILGVLTTS